MADKTADPIVELGATEGVPFIEQSSPLTRLHYFDGKFLRADALALEQDYHRKRTQLANLAGGWGAVHGLGIQLIGNELHVSPGLAITAAGNFVLASSELVAALEELLQVAAPPAPAGSAQFADCVAAASKAGTKETAGLSIYEITVGPVEGLCGNEPVFGKLCESACASDSRQPYWREGVVLRLRPVQLQLPTSTAVPAAVGHLRNRIASAYFRQEPWLTSSLLSAAGLAGDVWCEPAALYGRDEVVIGLLAREAGVNRVIDAWSGRRERMDSQARGYWQGRMDMRPWNVFIAQILQFQCQLSGVFEPGSVSILPADDCDRLRGVLLNTRRELEALLKRYGQSTKKLFLRTEGNISAKQMADAASQVEASFADIGGLTDQLLSAEAGQGALPRQRMLLAAGFFELPPAGYLPVATQAPLLDQLQRMFGEGVRLQVLAARHDKIAHLVEEAQHMDRISLTQGLDDPALVEDVQVFVPDGRAATQQALLPGTWWQTEMLLSAISFDFGWKKDSKAAIAAFDVIHKEQVAKPAAKRAGKAAPAPATSAATAADNPAAQLQLLLKAIIDAANTRPMEGLTRTEARSDGSYGFTLVVTLDLDDLIAKLRDFLAANPQLEVPAAVQKLIDGLSSLALYLAGDTDHDPLTLAIGDACNLKGELRLGPAPITISGTLTALLDRSTSEGRQERVVQARLVTVNDKDEASTMVAPLSLLHAGTAARGAYVIDDARHDPASSPNTFEWSDAPRRAVMLIDSSDETSSVIGRMAGVVVGNVGDSSAETPASTVPAAVPKDAVSAPPPPSFLVGTPTQSTVVTGAKRQRVLTLTGLPTMPAISSSLGAAAMNALVKLGALSDDAAFVARARRRLFPTLDQAAASSVAAVHDWVMFRRARTPLCCPPPQPAAGVALEALQVWHIEARDKRTLKLLHSALDSRDAKQLAAFEFRRVGVLRYRDEQVLAEEPQAQVLAMWRAAQPAKQAVLGRYWEQAPQTGQGWQNRFRLISMLGQIQSLVAAPPEGTGAIAPLVNTAPPLFESSFDGGMLVVTLGAPAVLRNALVIYSFVDGMHSFDKSSPHADLRFSDDTPTDTTLVKFASSLTPNQPVRGVTLAIVKPPADAGAPARLQAAVAALKTAGLSEPDANRQQVQDLTDRDVAQFKAMGVDVSLYDDIVFYEN